jgi:IstB-like ATP binding protein
LLTHPTHDLLRQLGFNGMAKAFGEIEASAEATALSHPEWLALLLDQEATYRRDRRLRFRLRYARLRHQATMEDVDYHSARGLDRALFQRLAEGAWIDAHQNLILCGPTGVGKVGSPPRSDTKPVVTITPFSTSAFPSCSPISRSPVAMAATLASNARSAACNY